MVEPIQRHSIAEQVYAQLRDKIVHGALTPGDALPSERVLAETLGINRGAVREALKRLQEARLISVKQGGPSRVLDFRKTVGIEMLGALIVNADGAVNTHVVRSIMEMRSALAAPIAAAAARRSSNELAAPLEAAVTELAATPDRAERARRSRFFWGLLVDGSKNIAYRLAYNALNETTDRLDTVLGDVMLAELSAVERYRALAACVARGDADGAFAQAASLVAIGEDAVAALLRALDRNEGDSA